MRRDIGRKIRIIVLFLAGSSQLFAQTIPTLTGYNSDPILSVGTDEAYRLFADWIKITSSDIHDTPTVAEDSIYNKLLMAERGDVPISDYNPVMGTWAGAGLDQVIYRMKHSKNLNFLEAALYLSDALLARRNDTINGIILPTTQKREPAWIDEEENRMSYLNNGGITRTIAQLAQWILDNPELYSQKSFSNSTIPISGYGTTYLERAQYYLKELKKTFDAFDREAAYWEFNSDNNVGMYFHNKGEEYDNLVNYRKAHPEGIALDDFFTVFKEEGLHPMPNNRVWWFCDGYMRTAVALKKLDEVDGTNLYTTFYNTALKRVSGVMNYLDTYGQRHDEAEPLGRSITWPYGTDLDYAQKYEDNTHFHMDMEALEFLMEQDVMPDTIRSLIASTAFSRYFSYDYNVIYALISRAVSYDPVTGYPVHGSDVYRPRGPAFSKTIAKYASPTQVQGFLHKSMELWEDAMREMQDESVRSSLLSRKDTRRSRYLIYPFQIYELKKTYAQREFSPETNHAPVFNNVSPVTIPQDTKLGDTIMSISAKDSDAGQSLFYWINSGNTGERFRIDPVSGKISLNEFYALNTELEDKYQLKIFATDDGTPVKFDSITVEINITPTNSAPVIEPNQYVTVSKTAVKGDRITKLKVTDAENDRIKLYALTTANNHFRIDATTGIISLKDADMSSLKAGTVHTLYVQVTDAGSPNVESEIEAIQIEVKKAVVSFSPSATKGSVPMSVSFTTSTLDGNTLSNYNWDFDNDGSIDSTGVSTSFTYDKAGIYIATLYVTDANGTVHAERKLIQVYDSSSPGNLIVHYDFNGDNFTVHDISGNGYDGTILSDGRDENIWISGVDGGALFFERTLGELKIPKAAFSPIVTSKAFTISFWLNDLTILFSPIFQVREADGDLIVSVQAHLYANRMTLRTSKNGTDNDVYFNNLTSYPDLYQKGWTHWAFKKNVNSGEMAIYVNGVKEAEVTEKTLDFSNAEYVSLGGISALGEEGLAFSIDEFSLYDKALSDEEIEAVYKGSFENLCEDTYSTFSDTTCASQPYVYNGETYTLSGVYVHHLTNSAGCDSVVTLNLTVYDCPNGTIERTGDTLYAETGYYNYQWLLNGVEVPGANKPDYILTETGEYSVRIYLDANFSILSDVMTVSKITSDSEIVADHEILVYPNPASGVVYLKGCDDCTNQIRIAGISGRDLTHLVSVEKTATEEIKIEMGKLPDGVYILKSSKSAHLVVLKTK